MRTVKQSTKVLYLYDAKQRSNPQASFLRKLFLKTFYKDNAKGIRKMVKKILKTLCWLAVVAFLAYTVVFGWGSQNDGSMSGIKLGLDLA